MPEPELECPSCFNKVEALREYETGDPSKKGETVWLCMDCADRDIRAGKIMIGWLQIKESGK